jgi:hypothetical protein
MLADNKIALNASWDMDLLANELADLSSMDLEFNLELTGFEVADIDFIIGEADDRSAGEVETAPVPNECTPVITDAPSNGVLCSPPGTPGSYQYRSRVGPG